LPEPVIEVGPVLPVGYAEPLSDELARSFDRVIHRADAFLMQSHGCVICGREGPARTLELLEMIEATAYSVFVAMVVGKAAEIPEAGVRDLERTRQTRGLPLPGDPGAVQSLTGLYFKQK
jgi:ribulose-5-phosphate 4-epimerase/fuculose-1-phosphate aldolase